MPDTDKKDRRVLALDIGGGTQDILLWDPDQTLENAVKLVLPSPTQILARRVAKLTLSRQAIFLTGTVMGGGAISRALRRHLQNGLHVYSQTAPAFTLHDNLDRVQQLGIALTETPPPYAVTLTLSDVDLPSLARALGEFEVTLPSRFALAVQDHGFSPQVSNRQFRFQHWEAFLAQGGRLNQLAYFTPPPYFTRMLAGAANLPGALLMDTCAAGVRGALLDPTASQYAQDGLTVVNIGNEHTFAALVQADRLWGIYEHHTGLLTPAKLAHHLERFQAGILTNGEVFADNGHGCALTSDYRPSPAFQRLVITGPQRRLAQDFPAVFAAPGGDMMLSGCFGLIAALQDNTEMVDE